MIEFQIHDENGGNGNPFIAVHNNGFIITWNSLNSPTIDYDIQCKIYDFSLNVINNFIVNTNREGNQTCPMIEILDSGFVVCWSTNNLGIRGQKFNFDGSKNGDELQISLKIELPQSLVSVKKINNNNYIVLWSSYGQDGSIQGGVAQLFDNNFNKIGNEFIANNTTIGHQFPHSVVETTNGFIIFYGLKDNSEYGIFGQLFDNDGKMIGDEFLVNSTTQNNQQSAYAHNVNNTIMVTWTSYQQDGHDYGIFCQILNEDCQKIGDEFQVNKISEGNQSSPFICSNKTSCIITWSCYGIGAFGRLFKKDTSNDTEK